MEFIIEHPVLTAYLFLKINSLLTVVGIGTTIAAAALVVSLIVWACLESDSHSSWNSPDQKARSKQRAAGAKEWAKRAFIVAFLGAGLHLIIPNQTQVAIMTGVGAGVTIAEKIGKSETMNKAYVALDSFINKELDEVISKNAPKKSEK